MLNRDLIFIMYIVETGTGLTYYKDASGNTQQAPITFGNTNLKHLPGGWMEAELGFIRNKTYSGINRSFSIPQSLVDDAAAIVRELMYLGRGIEVPLSLVIYKYNDSPQPGDQTYKFYYKGQIDIPKMNDTVAEGVSVNLMEGGVTQLLKAYENTVFEIPCDGSIPENIKVNLDGMLFEDTFNIEIVPMTGYIAGIVPLQTVFISNEGDNAGIIHNDQQFLAPGTNYYQNSNNFLFSSARPVTIRVTGEITVRPFNTTAPTFFELFFATSNSLPIGTGSLSYATSLVPATGPQSGHVYPASYGIPAQIQITQQTVFNIDATITLGANEQLFLMWFNQNSATGTTIVSGNLQMTFASQFTATRPWCITLYDLGRLLVKAMCLAASNTDQTFNYGFDSQLLQDNLNLLVTSGDALRASGDSNYSRFFNAIQNNPNFPNINQYYSYGPVIKTTWADFYTSVDAVLFASMSNQQLPGEGETIFVEKKQYVFDSSSITMELPEVADMRVSWNVDYFFNLFKIGYAPQSYDQKAGKYEWNTTAEWQTSLKTIHKTFEVISKYRADAYGIEKLRANIGDVSTTRNDSDNSVFLIDSDTQHSVPDTYEASFQSVPKTITNIATYGNANLLLPDLNFQSVNTTIFDGSYLAFSNAGGIFLFNQAALAAASFNVNFHMSSSFLFGNPVNILTGQPADTAVIKMFINGALFQTWSFTATGPSTPISIALTTTHNFSYRDCIYFTVATSVTATVDIGNAILVIDNGSPYLTAICSNLTIQPGIPVQVIAFPVSAMTIALDSGGGGGIGRPVISSGFQYFYFNSLLINSNFDVAINVAGDMFQNSGQKGGFDVWLNGVTVHTESYTVGSAITHFTGSYSFNHKFLLGDILFITGSSQNVDVWYTYADILLTSTQILASLLYREQYDAISGLPVLLGYLPGTTIPVTTGEGAPYNIRLSPKRMFMKWYPWVKAVLFNQVGRPVKFSTLSKNQYLSTTYQGVTITENAEVDPGDMGQPLFYPLKITHKTNVPDNFADVLTGAANAHVHWPYNGVDFYGFPDQMKQRPALNESQEWEMLASPLNDLSHFVNLDINGLNYINMASNTIFASFLTPVKFFDPLYVLPVKYHTPQRDQSQYITQITNWINQRDYWSPWQASDSCMLQFITNGLTPVVAKLFSCTGTLISTTALTNVSSNAVVSPYLLWQGTVDLSMLPQGGYFLQIEAGTGGNLATLVSEGMYIKPDWPGTVLIEATHSVNKISTIFDTGYICSFRVQGYFDNSWKPKYKGAFYVDQPQDIQVLNAIPYETGSLWVGRDDGVPDYMTKKIARALLLDGCMLEGEGFSLNEGAEWEETFIAGNPKKYQKIEIRPSKNLSGITVAMAGGTADSSMIISLDASMVGPNAGNSSMSVDPEITQIAVS